LNAESLSSAVRCFIAERIDSVGQLETTLLLHANPGRDWTAAQLAAELRVSELWAEDQLLILARRGLAAPAGPPADPSALSAPAYRYGVTGEAHAARAEVAAAYSSHPDAVTSLIYGAPNRAVRGSADAPRSHREEGSKARGHGGTE